jgi:hypothetical protein
MTFGILALPELADCFGRVVQPVTICQQRHQFDGAKEFFNGLSFPAVTSRATSSLSNSGVWPPVRQSA